MFMISDMFMSLKMFMISDMFTSLKNVHDFQGKKITNSQNKRDSVYYLGDARKCGHGHWIL